MLQEKHEIFEIFFGRSFHTEERLQIGLKKDIPAYTEAKYGVIEIEVNEIRIHYFISKSED
jgi:hypothetical protein